MSPPAQLAVGAKTLDSFDAWIASLNDNFSWTSNRQGQLRRDILDLLRKGSRQATNEDPAALFDEDTFGEVRRAVDRIWGDDPRHQPWISEIRRRPWPTSEQARERLRQDLITQIETRDLPETRFSVDAEAQLMRYAYGVTAATDFDLKKGRFTAQAKGELDLALAQAKAMGQALLPDEKGQSLDIPVINRAWEATWKKLNDASCAPTFEAGKTFLSPGSMESLAVVFTRWRKENDLDLLPHTHPELKIQLIGHGDGSAPGDAALAERRARVVYGYLTKDSGQWLPLFDAPGTHGGWGAAEIQQMLNAVDPAANLVVDGDYGPKTTQVVLDFQKRANRKFGNGLCPQPYTTIRCHASATSWAQPQRLLEDGTIIANNPHDPTLVALVDAYLSKFAPNPLPPEAFRQPPWIAAQAGEAAEGPVVQKSRRVEYVLYRAIDEKVVEERKDVPLGSLRLCLQAHLSGFAGANLMAAADIHFDVERGTLHAKGVRSAQNGAAAEAGFLLGARAELGCTGILEWKSPEPPAPQIALQSCHAQSPTQAPPAEFVELGSVGYTVTGQVGVALNGKFQVGFDLESQKFVIKLEASAALGPGFGGKLAFTVGVNHTYNFIAMVYTQLRDNDFTIVDFFDKRDRADTFDLFCAWSYQMLLSGNLAGASALLIGTVGAKTSSFGYDLLQTWVTSREDEQQARQLIENISHNAEVLRYTPPEVKGRILFLLVNPNWKFSRLGTWFSNQKTKRMEAALTVLAWIQSKRDCQEVLEHMGVVIPQGDGASVKESRVLANKMLLIEFLNGLGVTERKWEGWYAALPDGATGSSKGPVEMRKSPKDF